MGKHFFCFVDIKKAFHVVPSDKIWHIMEHIKVPKEYKAFFHKIYEKVRGKIKTKEGMSKCFGSDIGVK